MHESEQSTPKKKKMRKGELLFQQFDTHLLDVNFDFCGRAAGTAASSLKPTIKNNYVLHYITKGSGVFQINEQQFSLQANDCFILPKNIVTSYWSNQDDPWEYVWIGMSGTKLEEYLKRSQLMEQYCMNCLPESQFVSQILTLLKLSEVPLEADKDLLLSSEIYKMLYYLCDEYPKKHRLVLSTKEHYFFNAVNFIQNHYQQDLTVQSVAEHLSINRGYLHRIFKELIELSPQEYIKKIRMERSTELLTHTDYSISKIANSVGYADPLNFSKAFSLYYAIAPTVYRKQHVLKK